MSRQLKMALYLFFFGILSVVAALAYPVEKHYHYSQSDVLGLASPVDLFIEPDSDPSPLLDYVHSAKQSVWMTMYLLSDPEIVAALKEADSRGVDVKVILEEHPFGGSNLNRKIKPELEKANIEVKWGGKDFPFTHQKTLIIDGQILCILNQNLTKSAFISNREYNLCLIDASSLREATAVFTADWTGNNYDATDNSDLLLSPINSRAKLELLFNSAGQSIDLVTEVIDDPQIMTILQAKHKETSVRVLLPSLEQIPANSRSAYELVNAGVEVRTFTKPYLHAKAAIIDGERAYLGSINMTTNSLDENRELGIIFRDVSAVLIMVEQFAADWENAQPLASDPRVQ